MEKGVAGGIYFLCIAIVTAFAMGFALAYAMNLKRPQNVRDPTFQEALQFICSDQTDKNQYNQSYTCIRFSDDFVNNALNEGYICGYVKVEFREASHAIVCFNTSDRGIIFIEPQNDQIVTLAEGKLYLGRKILQVTVSWPVALLDHNFAVTLVPLVTILQLSMTAIALATAAYKLKRVT